MRVRSDWLLKHHMIFIAEESQADEVKSAVNDVVTYIDSGSDGYYKTGAPLIRLLEISRLRASEESEWNVVRLVQDGLDYAEGRILEPEFEDRCRLFRDGKSRSEPNKNYLGHTLWLTRIWAKEMARNYLDENPQASGQDVLDELSQLAEDARFIEAPQEMPGRYRIVRRRAEMALWMERVLADRIDIESPKRAAEAIVMSPEAVTVLAGSGRGQAILRAAELIRQDTELRRIQGLIEAPEVKEQALQEAFTANAWLFGGRFISLARERRMVTGDEYDIPLIRTDGSLHVIELKRAMGATSIVKSHRGSLVPTAEVHDAAAQAINYLVGLDENRARIKSEYGVEVRRASATVLIGHPNLHPDLEEQEIYDAFRTMSAHLNRVEVLTYKEVLDGARIALAGTDQR